LRGVFGLVLAVLLYFLVGPLIGEDPFEAFESIGEKPGYTCYTIFLTVLFYIAGLYQIMPTGVMSSMTRNVWKNFRSLVVWIVGIIAFFASSDGSIGEEWVIPSPILILGGFAVMMFGLYVYYRKKSLVVIAHWKGLSFTG
jgi:hypothetical protein